MGSVDSLSTRSDSLPKRNAVAIFLAHFHVRRGNELLWHKGEVDLAGVEWKVLPSGSHAVQRDIIYFEVGDSPHGSPRIGVAAFRNQKLEDGVRGSAAEQEPDDDQRGARMMAVGAILECGQPKTPWSLLAATLPHLSRLERLVDALSVDPSCRELLVEWLEMHKIGTGEAGMQSLNGRDRHMDDPLYPHDPLLQLPAITNALGPLLPSLLKRLLLPRFRLLLYVPAGAPTYQAAGIAFALAEMAYAACQSEQFGKQCPVSGQTSKQHHGLTLRGLIGLYDIAKLQDEARKGEAFQPSWIALTTDRILLEKCELYDAVLDLSPMASTERYPYEDFLATPTALPRLMCTHRSITKEGRKTAELKKHTWTAREFAVFRGLDEQASMHAVSRRGRRRMSVGNRTSQISIHSTAAPLSRHQLEFSPTKHLSRQGTTSTFLAYLRFWLANLWILPYHWRFNVRESYGYVPLGIRSDGGVRASIMLLPDDDSDGSEDESLDQEQEAEGSQHLSLPSSSPRQIRRHSGEVNSPASDEEDDPILAACGATQTSSRQRKSRSYSSQSRSGMQHLAGVVSQQLNGEGRPTSPTDHFKASSTSGGDQEEEEEDEATKEAGESFRLSMSIFDFWSLWIKEVVIGVQDLVEHKLLKEREDAEEQQQGDQHPGDNFGLLQVKDKPLLISPNDLSELRLSASNPVDVELVSYLSSTVTTRSVQINRSWWSIGSCLWS